MKAVIHIEIDESDMSLSINDILNKLKKTDEKQQTLYSCAKCNKKIPEVVASFCLNNKDRFNGKVYCRDCQGDY